MIYQLKTENFKIYIISDGVAAIDGGAMFGVVPKIFWEKYYPCDEKNRVDISLNCLLIETKDKKILVDTGVGNKFEQKYVEIYNIRREKNLVELIKEIGLSVEDINIVINTHLHFDHCGWNTINENDKNVVLFKNAKYFIQKKEWYYAYSPDERSIASYKKENFLSLYDCNQLELIDGDAEIEKGIKLIYTSGHSFGHQTVLIEDNNGKIFFCSDLIPTAFNLKINYTSAFDIYPLEVMEKKKKVLNLAKNENWTLVFPHEINNFVGKYFEIYNKIFGE